MILSRKKETAWRWLLVGAICLLVFPVFVPVRPASAQTDVLPTAQNLSNTGASSVPSLAVDANGGMHAFWYDRYTGNKYSYSADGVEWTTPVNIIAPFENFSPLLLPGPDNSIHALWLNANGHLVTSMIKSDRGDKSGAWGSSWGGARTLVQASVASFRAVIDQTGTMHLVYLHNREDPDLTAGVYYLQSVKGGSDWLPTNTLIYSSPYFRGLEPAYRYLGIAASSEVIDQTIIITWDERPQQKVMMSRSTDKGATWETPVDVDRPDAQTGFATPVRIDVAFWQDQVLMVWNIGGTSANCSHQFQVSSDNGATWSSPDNLIPDTTSCPASSAFFTSNPDLALWEATINNQIYLVAWDGERWSEVQLQTGLSVFTDAETSQQLALGCQQFSYLPQSNSMAVLGCDQDSRGDIWFLNQEIGDLNTWFLAPTAWSRPVELAEISDADELHILVDSQDNLHSFWVQTANQNSQDATAEKRNVIMYSGQDGNSWNPPITIRQPSTGNIGAMAATISADDEVLRVYWGEATKE